MERLNICRDCNMPQVGDTVNMEEWYNCQVCGRETFGSTTSYYMYVHLRDNKIEAIASMYIFDRQLDDDYKKILKQAGWSFVDTYAPNFEPDYGQEIFYNDVVLAWKNFALDFVLGNPLTLDTFYALNQNDEAVDEAKELYHTGSARLFQWAERPPENPLWVAEAKQRELEKAERLKAQRREESDLPF